MEEKDKVKCFEKELLYIKNDQIREFAIEAIKTLPDYFFEVPASSTSKHHPNYAIQAGGLLKHTQAAVRISIEMFRLDWWNFTNDEKDLIIVSLILHDGWKSGIIQQKYTVTEHPIIAAEQIKNNKNINNLLPQDQIDFIYCCISRHMGQFIFDYKTKKKVLEIPKTKYEKFTFLMDYIASRKCLEFNFDVEIIRE
jgi:hypothetical protein